MKTDNLPVSTLTKKQTRTFGPIPTRGYGSGALIKATVRYDDSCNNGHNTFAITGEIYIPGRKDCEACGCLHEEIAAAFPELAPLIKWHLCSSDGPMHYPGNVLYLAGERDCWGLLKGEARQIRNGKTGQLAWRLEASVDLPKYVDSETQPTETAVLRYVPWCRIGEGKKAEIEAARNAAIWPDATQAQLLDETALMERLPALMLEFKAAVESLGFTY